MQPAMIAGGASDGMAEVLRLWEEEEVNEEVKEEVEELGSKRDLRLSGSADVRMLVGAAVGGQRVAGVGSVGVERVGRAVRV